VTELTLFRPPGLKSQHFTSIAWLAKATAADVKGLQVGSKTLEFRPSRGPGDLWERNITISAESPAASAVLVFQAVFPFLLFAGNESGEPVELTISGGTNVSFSPSYEYLDQVLLPTLESWFGVRVERRLNARGWSLGPASRGSLWFRTQPVTFGDALRLNDGLRGLGSQPGGFDVNNIDVTIIAPSSLHGELEAALCERLGRSFPGAECEFRAPEESRHETRIYVLLVARATTMRWGRDVLYSGKRKGKTSAQLSEEVARAVVKSLAQEISAGGTVDEFLQDQLVIFQALAEGRTSFPRSSPENEGPAAQASTVIENELGRLHIGDELRKDKTGKPFGDMQTDSTHTQTARWVAAKVLEPKVTWYNNGKICQGIGLQSGMSQ
jgi:RNA 3'-terminal phosphate cyclase (ATP)